MSRELALAGCPFRVGPVAALDPRERRSLERLSAASPGAPGPGVRPFLLRVVEDPPWKGAGSTGPDEAPARVTGVGGRVRVEHRRFAAEIDLDTLEGRLHRTDPDGGALEIALRVALTARLPALDALPLHAAGVVLDGVGIAFFGPSGAGKTTLAASSPGPIVSDELVALGLAPPTLLPTGFFGELGAGRGAVAAVPLVAAVELARGPAFSLERLDQGLSFRRLLGSILAPAVVGPWREALAVTARLVAAVPVYRLEWAPTQPPWDELRTALVTV